MPYPPPKSSSGFAIVHSDFRREPYLDSQCTYTAA